MTNPNDLPEKPALSGFADTRGTEDAMRQLAVPHHLRHGLLDYRQHHIRPGDFLYYVMCNDLANAIAHGDKDSRAALPQLVLLLVNHFPANSWGSRETVNAWLRTDTGASHA